MATKPKAIPQDEAARSAATDIVTNAIGTDINLEDAIADELLDSIDWQKVKAAIIRKAPQKLFAWLTSGNDTPVNISQFPELAALPSRDNEGAA